MASRWQLLTTLSDTPSAEALAQVLRAEGITVWIASEAHMLGQAVPCRILVDSSQSSQARWTLSQRSFTEEELLSMATGEQPL
jgi:hypothetical protein